MAEKLKRYDSFKDIPSVNEAYSKEYNHKNLNDSNSQTKRTEISAKKLMNSIADAVLEAGIRDLKLNWEKRFKEDPEFKDYTDKMKQILLFKEIYKHKKDFNERVDVELANVPENEKFLEQEARSLKDRKEKPKSIERSGSIKKSTSFNNTNTRINPFAITQKIDNGILTTAMNVEENKNQSSEKRNIEDAENSKIQLILYGKFKYWSDKLNGKPAKERSERDIEELEDFNNDPYGWIQNKIEKRIFKLERDLEFEKSKSEPDKEIIRKLTKKSGYNQKDLDDFKKAWDRNLKLKLNEDFQVSIGEIKVTPQTVFSDDATLTKLNTFFKENSNKYEVTGNFQKGNDIFLTLKDSSGVEKEISLSELAATIGNEPKSEYGKEDEFAKIKAGEIIRMRVGGENGHIFRYKIISIGGDKINYIDLSNKNEPGAIKMSAYKSMLMKNEVEFYVESEKAKENKKEATKTEPKSERKEPVVDLEALAKAFKASDEEVKKLEQKKDEIINTLTEIEKQEKKKEKVIEKYSRSSFEAIVEPVFKKIFDGLEEEKAEVKEFKVTKSKIGNFIIESKVIVHGKANKKVTMNITVPIETTKKTIYINDTFVTANLIGKLFVGGIKEKIESALSTLSTQIKSQFEKEKGRRVESIILENGEAVVQFGEEKETK